MIAIRAAALVALVLGLVIGACTAMQVRTLHQRYQEAERERAAIVAASGDPTPAQQRLAAVARDASRDAAEAADPLVAVGLYQTAALAAWKSGPFARDLVLPVHDAGVAACERLPERDLSAPRDCALIRLSLPAAVHDQVAAELAPIRRARDGSPPVPPSAAQAPQLETAFATVEAQLAALAALRARIDDPRTPPGLIDDVDRKREQAFCTAVLAWSLLFDVPDTTPGDVAELSRRKQTLEDELAAAGLGTSCQPTGGLPARAGRRVAGTRRADGRGGWRTSS